MSQFDKLLIIIINNSLNWLISESTYFEVNLFFVQTIILFELSKNRLFFLILQLFCSVHCTYKLAGSDRL